MLTYIFFSYTPFRLLLFGLCKIQFQWSPFLCLLNPSFSKGLFLELKKEPFNGCNLTHCKVHQKTGINFFRSLWSRCQDLFLSNILPYLLSMCLVTCVMAGNLCLKFLRDKIFLPLWYRGTSEHWLCCMNLKMSSDMQTKYIYLCKEWCDCIGIYHFKTKCPFKLYLIAKISLTVWHIILVTSFVWIA